MDIFFIEDEELLKHLVIFFTIIKIYSHIWNKIITIKTL